MLSIWLDASRAGHAFLGEDVILAQHDTVRDHYFHAAENWVAVQGDTVRGFIGLIDAFVGGLFVTPAAHGNGIGRMLIEHAADRLGSLTVDVYEQNVQALAFYQRCGFNVIARKEQDDEGRNFPLLTLRRA